ncbi:uncharacterized protein [Drosophila takahashii]|uniref:uncharacterized protein n=1 Tax=Drosophila takahashii TaxID=29030 RepID=UPI001CF91AE0|nr:uncharacterized protein LOC108061653 [Drosophila takahashii]
MCDPCRFLRRCISWHGGCCPRSSCSCPINTRNCRVVFPGEYQKFSDMVPPSFLLKEPKPPKKKKRSKSCTPCVDRCKDPCADKCKPRCESPIQDCEEENYGIDKQNAEECGQDDGTGFPGAPGAGFQEVPGAGFGFQPGQPTIIPCYGTYGPAGNAMIFGIPPPTQYGNFGIPGPMVLPVAPQCAEGQGDARHPRGPPAAGLPTQYSSKFNPCTGEIYQCGNQQMSVGRPTEMGPGPSYNQFCQGMGMRFPESNQYNPFNETHSNIFSGAPPVYSQQSQPMHFGPNNQNNYYVGQTSLNSSQVPQCEPSTGQVHQGVNRSKSLGPRNEFRGEPSQFEPNNLNYPHNSRSIVLSKSSVVQVSHAASRSKSQTHRNESRSGRSAKPTEFWGAPGMECNTQHYPDNGGERYLERRSVSKSISIRGQGDSRTHDSRKRNKSMEAPLSNEHESNIVYTQQCVGMGIDPSNQYFPYNDCAPLNATFVHQLNISHQGNEGSTSAKAQNVSKERPGKSKSPTKCPSSMKGSKGPPSDHPTKCYCTRFDPNNQYYPYFVSEESDCPPPKNTKPKERVQKNDCSELLSRITESCPPCDLQKWCHLLMPKEKRKNQDKPAAKKNKKADGAKVKRSKSKVKQKMSAKNSKEVVASESYPQTPNNAEESVGNEPQRAEEAKCPGGCKDPCPAAPPKPEMRHCGCSANLPEENYTQPVTCGSCPLNTNTGCTGCCNSCPWSWFYNPCNGCYYYCANCCNGCCNYRNYCCSPCGRCCSNSTPPPPCQLEKIPPRPKQREKPDKGINSRRNSAGATVTFNSPGFCGLTHPTRVPMHSVSTMPGYRPTASTHFNFP